MNDVDELKQYIVAHAKIQQIPRAQYRAVLENVHSDVEGAADSWAVQWTSAGHSLHQSGKLLEAARFYNMARFPYVDGPARQVAHSACVAAFDQWRSAKTAIEPVEVETPGGRINCWAAGLSSSDRRPLALVLGGIVSIKEQWAPLLPLLARQGFAGIVAELPGVGENTLRYTPESWRILSSVLDAVKDRADVSSTYAICPSFGGHMALRCALDDDRIKAVITVGAPVSDFFTDKSWLARVPRVTTDTLSHITGMKDLTADGRLNAWALSGQQLKALEIPVYYLASQQDEIIPPADVSILRDHVANLSLESNDDVHGSPHHAAETRLWVVLSLLRARRDRRRRVIALAALLGAMRRFSRR